MKYSLSHLNPDAIERLRQSLSKDTGVEEFLTHLMAFLGGEGSGAAEKDLAFSVAAELNAAGIIDKIPLERLQVALTGSDSEKVAFFVKGLPRRHRIQVERDDKTADDHVQSAAVETISTSAQVPDREAKSQTKASGFSVGSYIVYPAHGVGQISAIETQEVAGFSLELFVLSFEKDKMTLRVPTNKAKEVGMRQLSSSDEVAKAMETLKGKAKVKRAMWSRRAQEYEQKINSGDLVAIAEVVRDLHRTDDQREQSYSERQLYEAALERLTREVAAVSNLEEVEYEDAYSELLKYGTSGWLRKTRAV